MNDNSLFLAILISIFILIDIVIVYRKRKRELKEESHYKTIADRHAEKLMRPFADKVWTIIGLISISFFVSNVVLLTLFAFWALLQKIYWLLSLLLVNIDILAIKNGLMTTYIPPLNPYNKGTKVKVLINDEFDMSNGNLKENTKRLVYKIDDKIVYFHEISIEGLSEDGIKDRIWYFKKRFIDYSKYIPNSVFQLENSYSEIEKWFIYLDDLWANY